jgi:poly [ADP-ribose] polymerase
MNIVKETKMIMSDVSNNNNKFWYGTLYDNATVLLRWGRVGKKEQSKTKDFTSQSSAESFLWNKENEKARKGYKTLNVVSEGQTITVSQDNNTLKTIAQKEIRTKSPLVKKLIDYFTQTNAHNITSATGGQITFNGNVATTPLGIVTQDNINEANRILVNISNLVTRNDYGRTMENYTNEYLMLVPQDIGMRRLNIHSFFGSQSAVQKQKAIVDSLEASLLSATTTPIKVDGKVFDVEIDIVKKANIINKIKRMYRDTRHHNHTSKNLKVKTVYSVEIATALEAFEKYGKEKNNIKELWHGTRASNVLSILKGGLVIPSQGSAHVTGRMFGDGLYFSDQSTKALNYSHGYWKGSRDNNCFMFLADVAMGKEFSPTRRGGHSYPVKGYDSTNVQGGNAGVYNNEMIVYKTFQANLKYLVEFQD